MIQTLALVQIKMESREGTRLAGKKTSRVSGKNFWTVFLLQAPFPIMWFAGYKGIFFPLALIAYLLTVGLVRWKTTTYEVHVSDLGLEQELRDYQEKPWIFLFLFFGLFAPPVFEDIIRAGGVGHSLLLCIVAAAIFGVLCLIEFFRKVRF